MTCILSRRNHSTGRVIEVPAHYASRLIQGLRLVCLAGVAGLLGMAISYGMVRFLMSGMTIVPTVEPESIYQARLLRAWTNELVELTGDYLKRLPLDVKTPSPGARNWIERSFRPQMEDLRRRIAEAETWADLDAYRALNAAVDRTLAMASHPNDTELRGLTAQEVVRAANTVEDYIMRRRLSSYLVVPAKRPTFTAIPEHLP